MKALSIATLKPQLLVKFKVERVYLSCELEVEVNWKRQCTGNDYSFEYTDWVFRGSQWTGAAGLG